MIPGEIITAPGDIALNAGRDAVEITVANKGDRPVQVGSHYHFSETNPLLDFDRAKARGCRAIGIAGGREKCDYVTNELGFDACIDYKAHTDAASLYRALKDVTPDGVDGYFENVGGAVQAANVALGLTETAGLQTVGMYP